MVYYFLSTDGKYRIYMGRDKEENELLLRYGFPEDVWFHVDNYSSAHVYLRLHEGETIKDIPTKILRECCQLVKANSIKGNKLDDIVVVYTMFTNLRKEKNMVAGEVGFHREKDVFRYKVKTRDNSLVKKLKKTKEERFPDLRKDWDDRQKEAKEKKKQNAKMEQKRKRQAKKEAKDRQRILEYADFFDGNDNNDSDEGDGTMADMEDGFM